MPLTSGIPDRRVMPIVLMPVPAPITTQIHAIAVTARRAVSRISRSCRNTLSKAVSSGAPELLLVLVIAVNQPVLVPGDMGQRAVAPVQVEFDGADAFGKAGCTLGFVENPSIRKHRDHPVFLIGNRVAYRLAVRLHNISYLNSGAPAVEIPFEVDFGKERLLDRLDNDRKDLEHRADRLILSGENVKKRVTLGLVSPLIKDRLKHAFAMMDRPRKIERPDHRQIIEPHLLIMTLVDLERDQAGAVTVGRVGHRLTRAAVVAAAIFDVSALNLPILTGHFRLPRRSAPLSFFSNLYSHRQPCGYRVAEPI